MGAAVSVAIMATHCVARLSPQQYLHYTSVQLVDVIANSHSPITNHTSGRVWCAAGFVRAGELRGQREHRHYHASPTTALSVVVGGSTGLHRIPASFSTAYLHPELGALLRRVLHLLLIVGAHCCGTLSWKRSVCRVCAGVALSLVRSRAAIVVGPAIAATCYSSPCRTRICSSTSSSGTWVSVGCPA